LIHFFSLDCKPQLEPALYQKLKQWVEEEDNFIIDNKEDLQAEIEAEKEAEI